MENSGSDALTFLLELEQRHEHVLNELDSLNARVEQVLEMYSQKRHTTEAGVPIATPTSADEHVA